MPRDSPKSVLWLERSCRNFSRRVFSRTVIGGAPDAFWSEMRATRGMMGRRGRDCCLCSGFLRHVSPAIVKERPGGMWRMDKNEPYAGSLAPGPLPKPCLCCLKVPAEGGRTPKGGRMGWVVDHPLPRRLPCCQRLWMTEQL